MSLLEHIQSKMKPEPGKATLADLVLAKNEIPEALVGDMAAVPDCIAEVVGYKEDKTKLKPIIEIKPDRLAILVWIQLRHEKPDITKEEVMDMVSLADNEAVSELTKEINWFWSDLDREEFERRWALRKELIELDAQITPVEDEESEREAEVSPENPTSSESS